MTSADPDDVKLSTLARAARARLGTDTAAAVRDLDGRTYAATPVSLPSLQLSALQVAVAIALSSGATGFEAAVVVGVPAAAEVDAAGRAAVADVTSSAPVFVGLDDGTLSRVAT